MRKSIVRRFVPLLVMYLLIETIERVYVYFSEWDHIDRSFLSFFEVFSVGTITNILEMVLLFVPVALYLFLLPRKYHAGRFDRIFYSVIVFVYMVSFLFEEVAEVLFWDEFAARFNFIAVDYLVYTQEVIGNINQSYPMVAIFSGIAISALILTYATQKWTFARESEVSVWWMRLAHFGGSLVAAAVCVLMFQMTPLNVSQNRYNSELAKDGVSSFVYAFFHNELDYHQFYPVQSNALCKEVIHRQLTESNVAFIGDGENDVSRKVTHVGEENLKHVMIVVMESMGYEFFDETGYEWRGHSGLTPHLSALSKEGLFFPNTYATGTRTVRGLEAVTLSEPPLPGLSIVRRDGNKDLYNVGTVFAERGYECKFVYGGYGYFDNMNGFYADNGFEDIDRTAMSKEEITFANVWGVCDEDLFKKAISEANKSVQANRKFLQVIMTTSNHRPFTYPEGKIDIPVKTGRAGGVKYADYAVGQFIAEVKKQSWFKDTVFVFIADHGAGTAGKLELNPESHQIPFIIYAPGFIKPKRVEKRISQIDAVPTLLGLLNISYVNKAYGNDALDDGYVSRYFVSNYQRLGYVRDDVMVVLKPVKEVSVYKNSELVDDTELYVDYIEEAVAYYQMATGWREQLSIEKPKAGDDAGK